ncbi:hypothetical protein PsYK624_122440 [Phanerochaete sordida]|uniref:Uncharacterized protein n=1 Tax=Phanerochaete sordida TaxID=48140 RepID=A0A9P3GJD1_9APHY|nr:hypothetical protein PsYK624_122440 [Phanerochaete sordida]
MYIFLGRRPFVSRKGLLIPARNIVTGNARATVNNCNASARTLSCPHSSSTYTAHGSTARKRPVDSACVRPQATRVRHFALFLVWTAVAGALSALNAFQ